MDSKSFQVKSHTRKGLNFTINWISHEIWKLDSVGNEFEKIIIEQLGA